MSNGNGFVTAVLASSDVRVQKQPFGSSRVGALGEDRRRRQKRRRRPMWGPGAGDGFFPSGGLSELRAYTAGPGSMDPASWMLTSQMQSDQYGWAFAPNGNPITPGNAYGPALAHGGQGPGRGFGPEYIIGRFDSTWADPPGNVFQKGVGMRAADSSLKLRQALIRRGVRGVRNARRGRAVGVEFDLTQPGQLPMAQALAEELAYGQGGVVDAALTSVLLRSPDGKSATVLFTDMPDSLHDEVEANVGGFGAEEGPPSAKAILIGGAVGAVFGGLFSKPAGLDSWLGAAIGGVVGSAWVAVVRV